MVVYVYICNSLNKSHTQTYKLAAAKLVFLQSSTLQLDMSLALCAAFSDTVPYQYQVQKALKLKDNQH